MPSSERMLVRPLYDLHGKDEVLLYAGDLRLLADGEARTLPGTLKLNIGDRTQFLAEVQSNDPWLSKYIFSDSKEVRIPDTVQFDIPAGDGQQEPDEQFSLTARTRLNQLRFGDVSTVTRIVMHIVSPLTEIPLPPQDTIEGSQGQIRFTLPDWSVVLAETPGTAGSFVIEATPLSIPSDSSIDKLRHRLFLLLSFITGKEVGLGPDIGFDEAGAPVWALWGAPRYSAKVPGRTWCPDNIFNEALPALAEGFVGLAGNSGLEAAVHRAIAYALSVDSQEPLEVRIPVACSGLELLGWAILQHHQWATADTLAKLPASAICRLLLQWAQVPLSLPPRCTALASRRGRLGHADWAGPEVLSNVRNGLVHPPKKIDAPEWPAINELVDAWLLGGWYLELAILRTLSYRGNYSSRLEQGWLGQTQPVPWATL